LAEKFPEKPIDEDSLEDEITYVNDLINVLEKGISEDDHKKLRNRYKQVKDLLEKTKTKVIQSASDEDAKIGHKSETDSFFGYKTHIAITEERLITAIEVTDGAASDGKQLGKLIEKSQNAGVEVTEVIGDTAYSGKDNLEYSEDIKIISKLHPVISNGNRKKETGFEFNKDADMMVCKGGYLAVKKEIVKAKKGSNNNKCLKYHFDVSKCKNCSFKRGCYKKNAKSKTYSVTILSDTHEKQKQFQETDYFKERARQRYMIEAKNAELKQSHGLDKCNYLGLYGMKIQSYFTAFASNIKRILKLKELKTV
jgi:IS5 family transposase